MENLHNLHAVEIVRGSRSLCRILDSIGKQVVFDDLSGEYSLEKIDSPTDSDTCADDRFQEPSEWMIYEVKSAAANGNAPDTSSNQHTKRTDLPSDVSDSVPHSTHLSPDCEESSVPTGSECGTDHVLTKKTRGQIMLEAHEKWHMVKRKPKMLKKLKEKAEAKHECQDLDDAPEVRSVSGKALAQRVMKDVQHKCKLLQKYGYEAVFLIGHPHENHFLSCGTDAGKKCDADRKLLWQFGSVIRQLKEVPNPMVAGTGAGEQLQMRVQELFNKKYLESLGIRRVQYKRISSGEVEVLGMPPGVKFRKPSDISTEKKYRILTEATDLRFREVQATPRQPQPESGPKVTGAQNSKPRAQLDMLKMEQLRKKVRNFFNKQYYQSLGVCNAPYNAMRQGRVEVEGMPKGIPFKNPNQYSCATMRRILAETTSLLFRKIAEVQEKRVSRDVCHNSETGGSQDRVLQDVLHGTTAVGNSESIQRNPRDQEDHVADDVLCSLATGDSGKCTRRVVDIQTDQGAQGVLDIHATGDGSGCIQRLSTDKEDQVTQDVLESLASGDAIESTQRITEVMESSVVQDLSCSSAPQDSGESTQARRRERRKNTPGERSSRRIKRKALSAKAKEYVVEELRAMTQSRGHLYFYVKWEGYPDSENTWEPKRNLPRKMVTEFKKKNTAE